MATTAAAGEVERHQLGDPRATAAGSASRKPPEPLRASLGGGGRKGEVPGPSPQRAAESGRLKLVAGAAIAAAPLQPLAELSRLSPAPPPPSRARPAPRAGRCLPADAMSPCHLAERSLAVCARCSQTRFHRPRHSIRRSFAK
jgi:hypothetical protein